MASARRHAFVVTACVFWLVVNIEAVNTLAPSLRQASEALKANEWPSLLQAQDALWPSVMALHPLLGGSDTPAARRRLSAAAATGAGSPFPSINQALDLLSKYSVKMLQLQALDVEQSISNTLKDALGIPVNESALVDTEAATRTLEDAMSALALHSVGTGAQLMQAGSQRLAQRLAALNATTSAAAQRSGGGMLSNWQGMVADLSGQLDSLLAGSQPSTRRLQEEGAPQQTPQQRGPEAAAQRLAALAGRLQQLRSDRAALRAKLRAALGQAREGLGAGRQLRQAAAEPLLAEPEAVEEAGVVDAPLWQLVTDNWAQADVSGADDSAAFVLIQEAGLVPAASQVLLTDVLFLVRDAIDLALGSDSPTPGWAGAYGYLPGRSPFFPLLEPVPEPFSAEGEAGAWWGEASADAMPAEAQPGRRLRQAAAASGAAPLPGGNPPATALLEGAAEYGGEEYGEEDAAAYEELYDAAYYGESESDDTSLDDWLLDDPEELYMLMVQLVQDSTTAGTAPSAVLATALPSTAAALPASVDPVPSLPVFAVWTGSSRGAVVPSASGGSALAIEQGQPLELLVAPFASAARTPVPRGDDKSGFKFDARYLGAVASAAFLGLLLLGAVVAWLVRRRPRHASVAEQEESLLYQHIPGTYKAVSSSAAGTPWAAGSAKGTAAIRAAAGPQGQVSKKLSNLPA